MTAIYFTSHAFECSACGDDPQEANKRFLEAFRAFQEPSEAVLQMVQESFTSGIVVNGAGCCLTIHKP